MESNGEKVKEYEIVEYVYIKEYGRKKLYVRVYDLCAESGRGTVIICDKLEDSITLDNATDEQIMTQVDNMFRNAVEVLETKSLIKKIKGLFK